MVTAEGTENAVEDPNDPEVKKKREQFDKTERIEARKTALYMN